MTADKSASVRDFRKFHDAIVEEVLVDVRKAVASETPNAQNIERIVEATKLYRSEKLVRSCVANVGKKDASLAVFGVLDGYPYAKLLLATGADSVPAIYSNMRNTPAESVNEISIRLLAAILVENYGREIQNDRDRLSDLVRSLEREADRTNPQQPSASQNFRRITAAIRRQYSADVK